MLERKRKRIGSPNGLTASGGRSASTFFDSGGGTAWGSTMDSPFLFLWPDGGKLRSPLSRDVEAGDEVELGWWSACGGRWPICSDLSPLTSLLALTEMDTGKNEESGVGKKLLVKVK